MDKKYFILSEDFEGIIRAHLANVSYVEKIPTGWTNFVFVATTTGGEKYICRFPRNDFFADCLVKEVPITGFMRGHVLVNTVEQRLAKHEGRNFSIHKMVSGQVMQDTYPSLNFKQKKKLAGEIADYILSVQNINPPNGLVAQLASEFLYNLSKVNNGDYDYSKLDRLRELEKNPVLVHGDLNPRNIILDQDGRLVAVLDYAFVTFSCDINDLARVIGQSPKDFYEIMVDAFEARTGKKVNRSDLDYLIDLWNYVSQDYVSYMLREHPDVVLPPE